MKKYAIILDRTNKVELVIEAVNMQTTDDGYVVELPDESTVKVGDIYNPTTQQFTIVENPTEEIE